MNINKIDKITIEKVDPTEVWSFEKAYEKLLGSIMKISKGTKKKNTVIGVKRVHCYRYYRHQSSYVQFYAI